MTASKPLGPAFTRFVAASGLTNLADGIATLAWAWVASLLTRDPVLIALVPVALRLPWFLCAIPAGIVTDRVDRKRLILWMDVLRGLAFACAAVALALHLPLPPAPTTGLDAPGLFMAITLTALAVGVAEVFRDNAAQTMLPAIVPHERLESANGRLWSVELIGNSLLGPPLAALLLGVGLILPFALNAVLYGIAILLVARVAGQFRPAPTDNPHWRRELAEATNFLRASPMLQVLALVTGFWNLFSHLALIALILYAQEILQLGATGYGLILAVGALGGVLGGIIAEPIVRRFGPARAAQYSLAASAPCFVAMAVAPGPITVAVALAVFELAGLTWNTVSVSYRQRKIPDELLGRVNSLYRLLAWGMMPIGLLASGYCVRIAEWVLPRETALIVPFWVAAAGTALLALIAWRALGRGLRQA